MAKGLAELTLAKAELEVLVAILKAAPMRETERDDRVARRLLRRLRMELNDLG